MKTKEIEFDIAESYFKKLPSSKQICCINPKFIKIDSSRNCLLKPTFWLAIEDNKFLLHSFYLNYHKKFDFYDIESAYGYGGPISNVTDSIFIQKVKNEFVSWCKEKKIIAEFLRLHPLIQYENYYWGNIINNRKTVLINLELDLMDNYDARRRTDVRSSYKNEFKIEKVDSKFMNDIFPNLYYENMKKIGASDFYLFNKKYFINLFQSKLVENWLLFNTKEPVAGVVVLINENLKTIEYHLSARSNLRDKSMVFMIHKISEFYKNKNYKSFFLGGGRTTSSKDSLLYFKKGFSPIEIDFNIGFYIYNKKKYNELKSLFNKESNRILFYR